MPRSWTDEQLTNSVFHSSTLAQVLRDLQLQPVGGNYKSVQKHIERLGLPTNHMLGKSWAKGQATESRPRIELADALVENSPYGKTSSLKRRLVREGLLVSECATCKITDWLGEPLVLHLDHVNGRNNDNRIENLRLLCPNCHSQTDTYCGRNKGV